MSGTTTYQYDYGVTSTPANNRSQLTKESSTRTGSIPNAFVYDGNVAGGPGNPTTFAGSAYTFNANNQNSTSPYVYDGNGNQAQTGQTTAFDPENRMTAFIPLASG